MGLATASFTAANAGGAGTDDVDDGEVILLSPSFNLTGFANPAVVTVWAVFILSGGLSKTGVANVLGQQVLRLAGGGEVRLWPQRFSGFL